METFFWGFAAGLTVAVWGISATVKWLNHWAVRQRDNKGPLNAENIHSDLQNKQDRCGILSQTIKEDDHDEPETPYNDWEDLDSARCKLGGGEK